MNWSVLTLKAVTELYVHSITRSIKNLKSMEHIKDWMVDFGQKLIINFTTAKDWIFSFAMQIFKTDDVNL